MHLLTLLPLALLPLASARCTKSENTSFVLTTFNTTTSSPCVSAPSLNDTLITISPYSSPGGILGIFPAIPPGSNSVLPHFEGDKLYRWNGGTKEIGFLETRKQGKVVKFVPESELPEGAVIGKAEIGCDGIGRHFLILDGKNGWAFCKPAKKDGAGYLLVQDPTEKCRNRVDVKWIWIDYVQPATGPTLA
ncbi:hypothetical protein EX30DRAFT_397852 [Ascodesmis nigricans]|uniref:Cell wall protein PhiA n=1 Tax=Ascodesmis nigricans TaxID=341454 RepID=A0A4V3SI14_9PEZI|nr:hypothetical protein EX30DRAFT_397852 [Ascodesmis nigricans]